MKIRCQKNSLQEAISIVQKAVTGKSTMPILQGILLKAEDGILTLSGSDIDLSIETKLKTDSIEKGQLVLDSKLFGEIIKKLPNSEVEIITTKGNSIEILCEKSKFTLVHMNAEDFPMIPRINENMIFTISQKILKNMIKRSIFAIAQDETRPIYTGVLFQIKSKMLNLVALDGFRLALTSENVECENEINAIIPGKNLNEIAKILEDTDEEVHITFTPNQILVNLGNTKIISRLLEGEFIKYSSIIPEEYNLKITAKRTLLLNCIERASLMAKEGNTNLIKFDIEEDTMVITSNSQLGKVREEMNILLQGRKLQIAFNSRYLIDILKIIDEDEIVMELSTSVSPCVIKNKEKEDCTYLVLPVRLLNN